MYWANFLHIYQPPTQKPYWIHRVTAESYRKLFQGLLDNPSAKLTININAVLVEHWDNSGETDVIETIRTLLSHGQLELTGSAKFHPLLPFLPKEEIVRQIKLNDETHRKYFGDLYKPKGFFPPEMAYQDSVGALVQELGFEWIIIDELSFPRDKKLSYDKIYKTPTGLTVYFRERQMSWVILSGQIGTGKLLMESLGKRLEDRSYLLTAMDGETFGHHRPGLEELLFEIYALPEITTVFISDLPKLFETVEEVEPLPSTWALMEKDLERKVPFARWNDADNEIHKSQWELTNLAIRTLEHGAPDDSGFEKARDMLDRALHSDQYWWASAKPWWSIEMIERGAKELYNAIIFTPGVSEDTKREALELYHRIVFTAFEWQRSGRVDKISHEEDEDIRQRTDQEIPRLPRNEVEKMIAKLQAEMKLTAEKEEFERAAQIRNRIAELKRYESDEFKTTKEGSREWDEE